VVEDLAAELVAEDHGLVRIHEAAEARTLEQRTQMTGMMACVQVTAADAADQWPHEDLAGDG